VLQSVINTKQLIEKNILKVIEENELLNSLLQQQQRQLLYYEEVLREYESLCSNHSIALPSSLTSWKQYRVSTSMSLQSTNALTIDTINLRRQHQHQLPRNSHVLVRDATTAPSTPHLPNLSNHNYYPPNSPSSAPSYQNVPNNSREEENDAMSHHSFRISTHSFNNQADSAQIYTSPYDRKKFQSLIDKWDSQTKIH
jgi:hypothetical protein